MSETTNIVFKIQAFTITSRNSKTYLLNMNECKNIWLINLTKNEHVDKKWRYWKPFKILHTILWSDM